MCINPKSPWLSRVDEEEKIFYWFRADCELWTCPECAEKRKTRVAARAGRGAEYFAKIGYPVQFTTLTCHRKVRDRDASIQRWRQSWPRMRKRISRRSPEFHYALFPEQHQTGAVHVHLLETSGLSKRFYKDSASAVGLGYMVDVEVVDTAVAVVAYVTKYMAKAIEVRDWPAGFHRFRFSRQWPDIDSLDGPDVAWRVFTSQAGFDDEARYWYSLSFKLVNTRTGEMDNA